MLGIRKEFRDLIFLLAVWELALHMKGGNMLHVCLISTYVKQSLHKWKLPASVCLSILSWASIIDICHIVFLFRTISFSFWYFFFSQQKRMCVYVTLKLVFTPPLSSISRYSTWIWILTFLTYCSFHLSRKPISVVKNVLNQNCSSLTPDPGTNITNNSHWCDWKPFGELLGLGGEE